MPQNAGEAILLVLGGLLILLGCAVAVVLLAILRRRARTFPCPECSYLISKETSEVEGVTCPACGWQVRRKEPGEPPPARAQVSEGTPCRRCGVLSEAGGAVRLWDGEAYCRGCLDAACPGLAQYAEENSEIADLWPFSAWKVGAGFFCTAIAWILLLMLVVVGIGNAAGRGDMDFTLQNALGTLICFGVPFFLFSVFVGSAFAADRVTVVVRAGRLVLRSPNGEEGPNAPLCDCRWFVGDTSRMRTAESADFVPGVPFTLGHPALLIELKPEKRRRTVVAVGHTPESRKLWEAFLTLAGVPQGPPRFGRIGAKALLDWAVMLLMLPAGVVAGAGVGAVVRWLLREAFGDPNLAANAFLACLLIGLGMGVPALGWYRELVTVATPEERGLRLCRAEVRRKQAWRLGLVMAVGLGGCFGFLFLRDPMSPLARWGGLGFFLVGGWLVGAAWGRIDFKYEREEEAAPEDGSP